MAKKTKTTGNSKSAAIRGYKAANPEAGPKEIVEKLAGEGVKVSAAFVSTTLSNDRRRAGKPAGRRGRKAASTAPTTLETLLQAKELANQLGGIEQAKQALDTLTRLLG